MVKVEKEEKKVIDYSYIISHNRVLFVEQIDKKEIEKKGKYSFGVDPMTGKSVEILDQDYGKSAELMRSILEEDGGGSISIIKIILGVGLIAIFIYLGLSFFSSNNEKKESTSVVPLPMYNQTIPNNTGSIESNPIPNNTRSVVNTGAIALSGATIELEKTKKELENLKKDLEVQKSVMAMDYSNTSLQYAMDEIELNLKKEKTKNTELEAEKSILETKNAELEKYKSENEKSKSDINKDPFIYFLGKKVYDGCNSTTVEEEKTRCANLYFGFVK